jgi:hypothetical protein
MKDFQGIFFQAKRGSLTKKEEKSDFRSAKKINGTSLNIFCYSLPPLSLLKVDKNTQVVLT